MKIAMKYVLALALLVLSASTHATLWRVDAVLGAYGLNYEFPNQKTKFAVQGEFDTEAGKPLWWNIQIALPMYVLELNSAHCNPYSNYCAGTAIRGGFQFSFSGGSPGGSWYLTLISPGVLTSAEFSRGGVGGFEGQLEHGTMIAVAIPEPSIILFVLAALGFVLVHARAIATGAGKSKPANAFDSYRDSKPREQTESHGKPLHFRSGALGS